jgi:hypothetical protein
MTAYCGVPLAGLYILPQWALLQVEPSGAVKKVEMNHRM